MTDLTTTIYIMGRGHSGSTILSGLIGHLDCVNDVGELIYPMRKTCGCGKPFANCQFWQQVSQIFEAETGLDWESSIQAIRDQTHFSRFPETLVARSSSQKTRHLAEINNAITSAVLKTASPEQTRCSPDLPETPEIARQWGCGCGVLSDHGICKFRARKRSDAPQSNA